MEEVISKDQQIKILREQGLSIRKIAEKLNIPKSTISDIMNKVSEVSEKVSEVSEKVSEVSEKTSESVRECPTQEQNESLAEIKLKFNTLLNNIYKRIKDIEINQESIKQDFNTRVNKVINTLFNNRLNDLQEQILNTLRRELKEQ